MIIGEGVEYIGGIC